MKPIPIFGTEANVPTTIGNLTHSSTQVFDEPGMGVVLRYRGPAGTKGDIYLFDLGLKNIPEDIQSREVSELFQRTCSELFALSQAGFYQDFSMTMSDIMPCLDDETRPMYHVAGFRYRQRPSADNAYSGFYLSHLALRTDRGFFTKVRYTYPGALDETDIEKIGYYGLFLFGLYDKIQMA